MHHIIISYGRAHQNQNWIKPAILIVSVKYPFEVLQYLSYKQVRYEDDASSRQQHQ